MKQRAKKKLEARRRKEQKDARKEAAARWARARVHQKLNVAIAPAPIPKAPEGQLIIILDDVNDPLGAIRPLGWLQMWKK